MNSMVARAIYETSEAISERCHSELPVSTERRSKSELEEGGESTPFDFDALIAILESDTGKHSLCLRNYPRHDILIKAKHALLDRAEAGTATFEQVEIVTGHKSVISNPDFDTSCPKIEINGHIATCRVFECSDPNLLAMIILKSWTARKITWSDARVQKAIKPLKAQLTIQGKAELEPGDNFGEGMKIDNYYYHKPIALTRSEIEDLVMDDICPIQLSSEWTRIEISEIK